MRLDAHNLWECVAWLTDVTTCLAGSWLALRHGGCKNFLGWYVACIMRRNRLYDSLWCGLHIRVTTWFVDVGSFSDDMRWLRLEGSLKTQVSTKQPCKRDDTLQKRNIDWRSQLIIATPYVTCDMRRSRSWETDMIGRSYQNAWHSSHIRMTTWLAHTFVWQRESLTHSCDNVTRRFKIFLGWYITCVMRHIIWKCVTWLTHSCDMTHTFVWHDSHIRVTTWLADVRSFSDVEWCVTLSVTWEHLLSWEHILSHENTLYHMLSRMLNDAWHLLWDQADHVRMCHMTKQMMRKYVTWLTHSMSFCDMTKHITRKCDMTHTFFEIEWLDSHNLWQCVTYSHILWDCVTWLTHLTTSRSGSWLTLRHGGCSQNISW